MAQPIPLEIPPRDPKRELLARIDAAPADYAAALLEACELLEALRQSGLLTLAKAALDARSTLVETAADAANTDSAIRATRNLLLLSKMLAAVDPRVIEGIGVAVAETFGNARSTPPEPPSFRSLVVNFLSRDMRRGLGLLNRFTRNLGYQLKLRTQSDFPPRS
jgi:uncharacterized protein YjgD (DUF1641 family)